MRNMKTFNVALTRGRNCQKLKDDLTALNLLKKTHSHLCHEGVMVIPLAENALDHPELSEANNGLWILNGTTFCIETLDPYWLQPKKKLKPREILAAALQVMLERKNLWDDSLKNEVPHSWESYGDLVIFNSSKYFISSVWNEVGADLWICVAESLKKTRVALKGKIKNDKFCSPTCQLVLGSSSWANCLDNKIRYTWDVEQTMFSAGNAPERHRIAALPCKGEVVIDMFAGIGYFTLPYLVYTGASQVHACEWNPAAVAALRCNLQLNKVMEKCMIHEGDVLQVCPQGVADRVNLGLIPSSEHAWKTACKALKPNKGGVLHIHQNVQSATKQISSNPDQISKHTSHEAACVSLTCSVCKEIIAALTDATSDSVPFNFFKLSTLSSSFSITGSNLPQNLDAVKINWKKYEWKVWALHVCHSIGSILQEVHEKVWNVNLLFLHHVKSYAPHVDHLVVDVQCTPMICHRTTFG